VGLTNEQANKLAPLAVKVQERLIEQQAETFETTKADWAKETQADPEIGGKNWKETHEPRGQGARPFCRRRGEERGRQLQERLSPAARRYRPYQSSRHGEDAAQDRRCAAEDGTFVRSEVKAVKKSPEEENYPDDVPKK
jgi:hypothetical protein